jgi:hypothetical protein
LKELAVPVPSPVLVLMEALAERADLLDARLIVTDDAVSDVGSQASPLRRQPQVSHARADDVGANARTAPWERMIVTVAAKERIRPG